MENFFLVVTINDGTEELSFLLAIKQEPGGIRTFSELEKAKAYFEKGFTDGLDSSVGGLQAGAILAYLQLRPFVVSFPITMSPLEVITALSNPDPIDRKLHFIKSNAFRGIYGVKINKNSAIRYKVADVDLVDLEEYHKSNGN